MINEIVAQSLVEAGFDKEPELVNLLDGCGGYFNTLTRMPDGKYHAAGMDSTRVSVADTPEDAVGALYLEIQKLKPPENV